MKKLFFLITIIFFAACEKMQVTPESTATGKSGSIARFAIKGDLMYAIDVNYLRVFDITNSDHPVLVQSTEVDYGLETIFIYDNYIYLGAVDGVFVLDINNPTSPHQLQKMEHHISCDPVVVQNDYAYSTQRVTSTGCGDHWMQSALAVYDVSEPNSAVLKNEITMNEPFGLAVEGNWLYVCDGGIAVYDITNPANPVRKGTVMVNDPHDIILNYPYMLIATNTSFELYNYSDPNNIHFVSTLALN
jgi:hypothetical protein